MPLILIIDTSTEKASIALANNRQHIYLAVNDEQKDHAAWIHQAIRIALHETNSHSTDLKAIAITAGPGSYTGLRVGMATAKGLCYALSIPLITINTLEAMAIAASSEMADALCPMIDARRMEVFTAMYNRELELLLPPSAMVLDENSFSELLDKYKVLFYGSGSDKFSKVCNHPHARFSQVNFNASLISEEINKKYNLKQFVDLAYTEPLYLKEFNSSTLRKLL